MCMTEYIDNGVN